MKYFFVLLCLFLCYKLSTQNPQRPSQEEERYEKLLKECSERAGVPLEELATMINSNEETDKLMNGEENVRKSGCFLACLYQEYGLMEGNTLIRQQFSDSDEQGNNTMAEQARDACLDIADGAGDECEVALAFRMCMKYGDIQDYHYNYTVEEY